MTRTALLLDARDWAFELGPFAALDWRFALRTDDAALADALGTVLAPLASAGDDDPAWYTIDARPHHGSPRFRTYVGGRRILDCGERRRTFEHLLWDINQQAFRHGGECVVLHAAAATSGGGALVLPGVSGAGKSTLVARLVELGLGYLTDEAAAVGAHRRVRPFPKAITLKTGSQALLPHLATSLAVATPEWHVTPDRLRPGAVAAPAVARWFVFVTREPGPTIVEPLGRAESLTVLTTHAVGAVDGRRFHLLADAVRGADCYRLVGGDLDERARAILALVAG